MAAAALSLPACSTVSADLTTAGAAIEKAAGYLAPGAVTLTADAATYEFISRKVPSAQQAAVAAKVYVFASVTSTLASGSPPSPAVYAAALAKATGNDPFALLGAKALSDEYTKLFPKLQAAGPNVIALIQAFADGIKTGAASFLPPVIPAPG